MVPLLTSSYLAPVHYYARLFHSPTAVVEQHCNYVKQTYRNRCVIAAANGPTTLSVPIEKPASLKGPTRDIRLSNHDHWNRLHWQALVSAYGNSPFFEYYRDDYAPFFEQPARFLFDFNEALLQTTLRLLHLKTEIVYTSHYLAEPNNEILDLRQAIHPKQRSTETDPPFCSIPYYQVFESKWGFLPNLSIVDLLFNMGPESLLVLRNSIEIKP